MPERQRGHVEQHHVLDVALQHAGLDGGTQRHDLVGVDALVRLLAEELGHFLDHFRHPGHAADQHHLVDVASRQAGILQRVLAGLERRLDQIAHQAFQLGAGQLHHQVQRLAGFAVHRDEGLVDLGLAGAGQLDLGLLGGFLEALQGHLVLGQVDAVLLLELVRQVVDDAHVEVFATQEGVAVGRLDLEEAVVDLEDGHVEGAAAQVIDRDGVAVLLVQAIGQRRRGRLVDDAQHFETGDLAGVLGGLTLGVVEIGRHGDHRLLDLFAEIAFCGLLHLTEDEGADLAGGILLALGLDPGVAVAAVDDVERQVLLVLGQIRVVEAAPDQALDAEDGVVGVGDCLALGGLPDQSLVIGEGDDRGRGARAFGILDHPGLRSVHDGDAAVGGPQVDANYFAHSVRSLICLKAMSRGQNPFRHPDPEFSGPRKTRHSRALRRI